MKKMYEEESVRDIADAIREKNGTQNQYTVAQMASAILNLPDADTDSYNVLCRQSAGVFRDNDITTIAPYTCYINTYVRGIEAGKVTQIGSSAFYRCTGLTYFSFPNCTTVKEYAFCSCPNLASIILPECTNIGTHAFTYCSNVSFISIPNITTIPSSAFTGMKKSISLDFPNVTAISDWAFGSCDHLTQISLPNCVSIYSAAFYGCYDLSELVLPVCRQLIGGAIFRNCGSLQKFVLLSTSVVAMNYSNNFLETPIARGSGFIYVPESLIDSYKSHTNWKYYSNAFRPCEDLSN